MHEYLIRLCIAFAGFLAGTFLTCILSASRIREAERVALYWKVAYRDLRKRIPAGVLARLRVTK